MSSISIDTTIEAIIAAVPKATEIFEKMGIDYCCGGKATLEKACKSRGMDPQAVLKTIQGDLEEETSKDAGFDPNSMSAAELADHIEQVHHAYLWNALETLKALVTKVSAVHGGRDPRLYDLLNVYSEFAHELADHMLKEEQILFPLIRQLQGSGEAFESHCGSVGNPIRKMDMDHEEANLALFRIRNLTDGYVPPPSACFSYRKMLTGLAEMDLDLTEHMRKETGILFPKALALESELLSR